MPRHRGRPHHPPASITDRVMSAFRDLGERNWLPINVNPVNQVNLGVSGVDTKLHVFKVLGEDNVRPGKGGADAHDVRQENGVANAEFPFVTSEVTHLSSKSSNLREELKRRDARHLVVITMLCKALNGPQTTAVLLVHFSSHVYLK